MDRRDYRKNKFIIKANKNDLMIGKKVENGIYTSHDFEHFYDHEYRKLKEKTDKQALIKINENLYVHIPLMFSRKKENESFENESKTEYYFSLDRSETYDLYKISKNSPISEKAGTITGEELFSKTNEKIINGGKSFPVNYSRNEIRTDRYNSQLVPLDFLNRTGKKYLIKVNQKDIHNDRKDASRCYSYISPDRIYTLYERKKGKNGYNFNYFCGAISGKELKDILDKTRNRNSQKTNEKRNTGIPITFPKDKCIQSKNRNDIYLIPIGNRHIVMESKNLFTDKKNKDRLYTYISLEAQYRTFINSDGKWKSGNSISGDEIIDEIKSRERTIPKQHEKENTENIIDKKETKNEQLHNNEDKTEKTKKTNEIKEQNKIIEEPPDKNIMMNNNIYTVRFNADEIAADNYYDRKSLIPVDGKLIAYPTDRIYTDRKNPDIKYVYVDPTDIFSVFEREKTQWNDTPYVEKEKTTGLKIINSLESQKSERISSKSKDITVVIDRNKTISDFYGTNHSLVSVNGKSVMVDSDKLINNKTAIIMERNKTYKTFIKNENERFVPDDSMKGYEILEIPNREKSRNRNDYFPVRFSVSELPLNGHDNLIPVGKYAIKVDSIKTDRRDPQLRYAYIDRNRTYDLYQKDKDGKWKSDDSIQGKDIEEKISKKVIDIPKDYQERLKNLNIIVPEFSSQKLLEGRGFEGFSKMFYAIETDKWMPYFNDVVAQNTLSDESAVIPVNDRFIVIDKNDIFADENGNLKAKISPNREYESLKNNNGFLDSNGKLSGRDVKPAKEIRTRELAF